jgi:hypothetical protein
MERKFTYQLLKWKKSAQRMPLIVTGARQAGKYKPEYVIRISAKNFGFENQIKSVPLYAVFCI